MLRVGHVESLWRYPVKSMRGEQIAEVLVSKDGLEGDRRYAIRNSAAPSALPFLTGRTQPGMLLYRPHLKLNPDRANGVLDLLVETPQGDMLDIHDPALLAELAAGLRPGTELSVLESDTAVADEYPVSVFSIQTGEQLSRELGIPVDKRRFRANIYVHLDEGGGFAEDAYVGGQLRVGSALVLEIVKRDPRCKMITLAPETSEATASILQHVIAQHERCAGVYATVASEGTIRQGDAVLLL